MTRMTKLWHDDIRRPPDESWRWARTNKDAIRILLEGEVTEASLDHDLGFHEADPDAEDAMLLRGDSPDGNGLDLAIAMVRLRLVPPKVTIHSWNLEAAAWMAGILSEAGGDVDVNPYTPPKREEESNAHTDSEGESNTA
jgi:hypothetical protein